MTYIENISDLEKTIRDERERPRDYKEHFYPCYVEYADSWDAHFCGKYYFTDHTPEQVAEMRLKSRYRWLERLETKKAEIEQEIAALKKELNIN